MKTKQSKLRSQAERQLARSTHASADSAPEDAAQLVHELEVHQIELRIQNENLLQSQFELIKARDKYADLFDSVPVGYLILNAHNVILDVNQTAAQMLSIGKTELHKKRFTDFIDRNSQDAYYLQIINVIKEHNAHEFDLEMIRADKSRFFANLHVVPMKDDKQKFCQFRVAIADITERKITENKITALNQSLLKGKVELENAIKELQDMEFAIIQDLKSSLRQISGFGQAVLEDYGNKLDKQDNDYLLRIRDISQRTTRFIEDLVKLADITTANLSYERVSLSTLVNNISQKMKNYQPERNIELIIEPGLEVIGDFHLLRLALENLLDNAFKFTTNRSMARIEFGLTEFQGKAAYFIKDNGVGFNMAYSDRLFVPFQRLHSQKEYPGTGIGLAIVQRIIHRHGGSIWAKAEPGQGATFYFTIS